MFTKYYALLGQSNLFLVLSVLLGFPGSSARKESACNAGGLIPGLGRSAGEGIGYPLQYSGLRIPRAVQSMGSQRVGQDWPTFTSLHFICVVFYLSIQTVPSFPLLLKPKPIQLILLKLPNIWSCWPLIHKLGITLSTIMQIWALVHLLQRSPVSPHCPMVKSKCLYRAYLTWSLMISKALPHGPVI